MPNFDNDIGSMNIVPTNYKYLHVTSRVDFAIKTDGHDHPISLTIPVDYYDNIIYYNLDIVDVYPNRKGLYDKFGIEVNECYLIDYKTLRIQGHYNVKFDSWDGVLNKTIYIDSLTHIAVLAPKCDNNSIIVHKELPTAIIPEKQNNIILFYTAQDVWINTNSACTIRTGLTIRVPDGYVLQVTSYENYLGTGLLLFDAPFYIHSKYCKEYTPVIKWVGTDKHIEANNYVVDQDDDGYIRKILIPMGTIIAQGIMVKTERISIHEY